jgi:integrase
LPHLSYVGASLTSARDKARKMLADLDKDRRTFDAVAVTFTQLADYYQQTFLIDPEYRDDRKIAGLRSKYTREKQLVVLKAYFGKRFLRSIGYQDLASYKAHRLKTPIVVGRNTRGTNSAGNPQERERSIASVHRELSFLRRILNVAVSNGWILRNPFEMGDSLIRPGDEKPRERIISKAEEERLLAVRDDSRSHLKAVIICALDTGMRRGEMMKLKWYDIDFENGSINIRAFNTKTMRQREVGLTARLAAELRRLSQSANGESLE